VIADRIAGFFDINVAIGAGAFFFVFGTWTFYGVRLAA
jgi:hypothetical protein